MSLLPSLPLSAGLTLPSHAQAQIIPSPAPSLPPLPIPAPMALPHVAQARMIEEPVVAKAQVVHPIPAPQPVATPVKKVFMPAPSSSTKKVVPQIAVHRAKVHQLPAFPPLAAAADIAASPMLSSDLHSSMSSFASASSNISDQDDSLADTHGMSSSSFTTSLDTLSDTRPPPSPTTTEDDFSFSTP